MIWEYICLGILLLLIVFWVYTKLAYPFWSHQPVVHHYDWVRRWFYYRPYVIQMKKPIPTKFNKKAYIISKSFSDINDTEMDVVVDFIQCHDHYSENRYNLISKKLLEGYLAGIDHAEISLLYDEQYKLELNPDVKSSYITQWILDHMPLGVICSYSLQFYMPQFQNNIPFTHIHYWSFLCVHREKAKKHSHYELLQTHDYRLRLEKEGMVSLYKTEGELCDGVVPFVRYDSHLFPLNTIRAPPLPKHMICRKITEQNFHYISDMLYHMTHGQANFPIAALCFPSLGNIMSRLKKEVNYCYVLTFRDELLGLFVFQDTFVHVENKGNVLECVLCYLNNYGKVQEEQFFAAFLGALYDIQKNVSKKYDLLKINELGHNILVLDKWKWKYDALVVEQSGLYMFNGGCGKMPLKNEECFFFL